MAAASAYGAQAAASEPSRTVEQPAKGRRARIEAETRKTLRDAQIFAGLLLALAATAIYGLAQLAGIV